MKTLVLMYIPALSSVMWKNFGEYAKGVAILLIVAGFFSCEKQSSFDDYEHIKSISLNGTVVQKFYYDHAGKIVEESSMGYFRKFIYDENGCLMKVESAFDRSGLSSSMPAQRTELMTSHNSVVDSYSLYEYDKDGKLSKIENYFNETGKGFEYRSTQTYEYDEIYITKDFITVNIQEEQITNFRVYTYDDNGNVVNEKYFSCNFSSDPELINENIYKYDSYKNPFRVFNRTGSPGLYTNVNNIIETTTIRHYEVPGFDKISSSKTTYQYKNGYPIKEITKNSEFEYNY